MLLYSFGTFKISERFFFFFLFFLQCADVGYHPSLGRVVQAYLSKGKNTHQELRSSLLQLQEIVSNLDQSRDKDILLQDHYNAFSMPARFTYQPQEGDQVSVFP